VLCDSGSGITWGNYSILPKGCNPKTVAPLIGDTLAGTFKSTQETTADTMTLPEFFKQRALCDVTIRMMDKPCKYDLILGRDVLSRLGIVLDFDDLTMTWDGKAVPMRVPPDYVTKPGEPSPIGMELYMDCFEDDLFDNDEPYFCSDAPSDPDEPTHAEPTDSFSNPNLKLASNTYKAVDIDNWVETNCQHLDESKRQELAAVLSKYPTLWDNKLGTYPDCKAHLDLKEDAVPHSS